MATTMSKGRVRVDLQGRVARFRALLSGPHFDDLTRALEGSRYDRERRAKVASLDKVPEILLRLRNEDFDVEADDALLVALEECESEEWLARKAARDRIAHIDQEMFEATGDRLYPFQRTGVLWLTLRYGAVLADQMGLGKSAAVSEPVLTPIGWRCMGELQVGDYVIGSDGRPTKVVGVFPQGVREQYRVELSDETSTRCDLDHLWLVQRKPAPWAGPDPDPDTSQVLTTRQLLEKGLRKRDGLSYRWYVPVAGPVRFDQTETSVRLEDFYLVGVLTTREKRLLPEVYLYGDVETRRALLAGILDEGGGAFDRPEMPVHYEAWCSDLAKQIAQLVRSLGCVAWIGRPLKGTEDPSVKGWTCVEIAAPFNPFRGPEKLARYTPYRPSHAIHSIEPCGAEESVCIRVEAEDQLYVTNDFIVTHNTVQSIAAIPANAPVLVVAPAVAKGVWRGQANKWRPQLRVSVLSGRDSFRWPKPGEMVVTNYDILPDIHDGRFCDGHLPPKPCMGCGPEEFVRVDGVATFRATHLEGCEGFLKPLRCPGCHPLLKDAAPGTVVIFDEAHKLKNPKSQRHLRSRALSRSARKDDGRCWELTGTPLENKAEELWALLQVAGLAEEAFGDFAGFQKTFKAKPKAYGGYDYGLPDDSIGALLQRVLLRRLREEVLPDLPTKSRANVEVDISEKALRECDRLIAQSGRSVEDIVRLVESEDSASFTKISSVRAALAAAKIPAMMEHVQEYEEAEEPVIVFSAHLPPIKALEKRRGWAIITGDVSSDKRRDIEERFQAGKLRGVACTIRAGGEAITLTRANQILFVDLDWKSTANEQAEDRASRIGQTRKVSITILTANHDLDRRVAEVIQKKMRLIEASVDAASVSDDAPRAAGAGVTFDEHLRDIRESAFAERREARSEDELRVVEELHTCTFASTAEEQLASRLADKASTCGGLTDAEWTLASYLLKQQEKAGSAAEKPVDGADGTASVSGPAKRAKRGKRGRGGGEGEQRVARVRASRSAATAQNEALVKGVRDG